MVKGKPKKEEKKHEKKGTDSHVYKPQKLMTEG